MPAKSVRQRRLMAMCLHNPKHMTGQCPDDLTSDQLHDFAATPERGLPPRKRPIIPKKKR